MQRKTSAVLKDIVESCERIIANTARVTLEEFRSDIDLQDAVIRRFEIIGEATKRVPEDIRSRYPDVPWRQDSATCLFMTIRRWSSIPCITQAEKTCPDSAIR